MAEFATESTADGSISEGGNEIVPIRDKRSGTVEDLQKLGGDSFDDNSSQAGSSIVTTEPKVSAPLLGTLVYGRILKRVTLIAVKKADRPHDLTETLLKQSKRSSSMTSHDIVAVINTKTGKVLKVKMIQREGVDNFDPVSWSESQPAGPAGPTFSISRPTAILPPSILPLHHSTTSQGLPLR